MTRLARGWRRAAGVWGFVTTAMVLGAVPGCSPVDRLQARLRLKEGNLSYLRGDYAKAVQEYDAALREVPDLTQAYLNRAYAHEALFRASDDPAERRRLASEAVRSFQSYLDALAQGAKADASAPSRAQVEQHIITLYLDSQQQDEAVRFLQARLARDPRDASTLQMLSHIEAERGNLEAALRYERQRVQAQADSPEAHYALGAFVWQMSFRNPMMEPAKRDSLLDEGLAALRRASELKPDYFDALIYTGLLYREKAKYATDETQRHEFERLGVEFRNRALAMRPAAAGAGDAAPASSSGVSAPAPPAAFDTLRATRPNS